MEIKPEELLAKIKNGASLEPLMLIYGEDDYYRKSILKVLPDFVFGETEAEERDITRFEKDTDLREVAAAINTYPFLSGRSLIYILDEKLLNNKQDSESGNVQQEKLSRLLEDIPEYCTIVVSAAKLDKRKKLFKLLQKLGVSCECKPLKTYAMGPWLENKAKELGGSLDRGAIDTIMEYLAPVEEAPLQLLSGELEKLAIYAGDRKRWTSQDVEAVFAALPEISAFALNKAISEHKTAQVLRLLAVEKKKKTDVLPLCGMLLFGLRRTARLKELMTQHYPDKEIAGVLKLPPTMVNRYKREAQSFTLEALLTAILELEQLNMELRQGGRQYERLEEILIKLLTPTQHYY